MVIMEKGMKKRKLIGVITVLPECTHAQRVLSGVFEQCEKYGYDVAVFAPMTTLSHSYEVYRKGELNIWELINFELLDGVIVDTISLINNGDETIKDAFCKKLETECKKPVVSLDFPLGDYPVAKSSNNPVFYEIMEHVLDYHGKKKSQDLAKRLEIANKTENSILVSIHMNAFPEEKYKGLQIYFSY